MEVFKSVLLVHVLCGSISLFMGLAILLMPKGNNRHRKLGNAYFYMMMLAGISAIVLSGLHSNSFLFIVGIFTLYMLISGKRYISYSPQKPLKWSDYLTTILMAVFGLMFIATGIYDLIKGNNFGIVLLVFGGISEFFVGTDVRFFMKKIPEVSKFPTHLQRMIGSYIAATTAFLVVNNTLLPGLVAWLLPTVVFTPLIVVWTIRFKKAGRS